MTDRHSGYIVVLDDDIREDDAEAIVTALRMIKGVQSVDPIVAEAHSFVVESRVRAEISDRLYALAREVARL